MSDDLFPKANNRNLQPTSPADVNYNCAAWALCLNDQVIWPDEDEYNRWPTELPRDETIGTFERFFVMLGYSRAADESMEKGFEKVVVYVRGEVVTHLSRQMSDGRWTTKIGTSGIDATHNTPAVLEDGPYGVARHYFKRAWSAGQPPVLPDMKPPKRLILFA